jgi:AcrR family transcriptional regulator
MLDKKLLILNTLENIIKSKRYHEVKIDDIAKKCKIGKGTIYTYFQSKDEMYFELAMHGLEVIIQELNNISIEDRDIKKVIFEVANKLNNFFERSQSVIKVLRELNHRTRIMTKLRKERMFHNQSELRQAIVRILQVGVEKELVINSHSLIQLAELMIHTLIGRAHWNSDVPKMSVEDLITLILFK